MKLRINQIKAGTILDGKICYEDGKTLFANRTVFTKDILKKLESEKVEWVEFYPLQEKTKKNDQDKKEEEKIEKILDGFHYGGITKEVIKESISSFRSITFNLLNGNDSIDFTSCKNLINAVYDQIKTNPSAIINLLDIKNHDDYTFCHSINVGIISLALAQKMGYPESEVQMIGLGGFLHDIGKIAIPASLINKTTVLSEEEKRIMKSHPSHSYRIMKLDKNLNRRIVNMAYEHHERYDGKGYPLGISGDKLDDYSVIVALADVYDALTTVRSYKPAFSPEESIQVIETYTGTHFAPRIAEKFIADIQNSLAAKTQLTKGSLVLLSTNELAQIIHYKTNPDGADIIVQLLTDGKNSRLRNPIRINIKGDKVRTIKRGVKTQELDGDSLRVNLTKSTSL